MEAGRYDRLIQIQRYTVTKNAANEDEQTWGSHGTERAASRTPISDGERFRADEIGSQASVRFRTRWDEFSGDVNTKDRILCEGKTYEIIGTKEIGRRQEVEITAAVRGD
jgi:SPP1 family predicted phage head-tail adaptor